MQLVAMQNQRWGQTTKPALICEVVSIGHRDFAYMTGPVLELWKCAGVMENADVKRECGDKDAVKTRTTEQQPQDDVSSSNVQLESIQSQSRQASTADILRSEDSPTLLAINSKKSVSLLGSTQRRVYLCLADVLRIFFIQKATRALSFL